MCAPYVFSLVNVAALFIYTENCNNAKNSNWLRKEKWRIRKTPCNKKKLKK